MASHSRAQYFKTSKSAIHSPRTCHRESKFSRVKVEEIEEIERGKGTRKATGEEKLPVPVRLGRLMFGVGVDEGLELRSTTENDPND